MFIINRSVARPQKGLRTFVTSPKIYRPPGGPHSKYKRVVPEGQSDEQITAYRQTGVPSEKSGGGGTVGVSISRFLGLWCLMLLDLSVCFNEESKVTGPQSFFEP